MDIFISMQYFIHIEAYRPVSRQRPRNKQRVQLFLCNRRTNKRPFLGNGSVNTPTTDELLKAVFSVGSARRLYNEDHRSAELITERELRVTSSFGSARKAEIALQLFDI
jgi:hypothetical protein